jgi:hypothetical protein
LRLGCKKRWRQRDGRRRDGETSDESEQSSTHMKVHPEGGSG